MERQLLLEQIGELYGDKARVFVSYKYARGLKLTGSRWFAARANIAGVDFLNKEESDFDFYTEVGSDSHESLRAGRLGNYFRKNIHPGYLDSNTIEVWEKYNEVLDKTIQITIKNNEEDYRIIMDETSVDDYRLFLEKAVEPNIANRQMYIEMKYAGKFPDRYEIPF